MSDLPRLTPDQCRVLGVLIEKAQTTASQYPLSINAMVNGVNQKSNREPVITMTQEQAFDALDGLRRHGLAREVSMTGSRVAKYRHIARERLEVTTSELVILAELLLRGPQTSGEIRSRASRMHPLESLDVVEQLLSNMIGRDQPLVRKVPPAPGSRAQRYAQLLCPDLHPVEARASTPIASSASSEGDDLARRVDRLEENVNNLRRKLESIAASLGSTPE